MLLPSVRRRSPRLPRGLALAFGGWLLLTPLATAQEASPTPAPAALPASEIEATAPHLQTIAQGIIGLDGPVVWRVREVSLLGNTPPEASGFAFLLQRTGTQLVRNETTSRRVKLEPGEAYFIPNNDSHVRTAVGTDPVIAWFIELVSPTQPVASDLSAGAVLLTSPEIRDYPTGSYDIELSRTVLLPGDTIELPRQTGPFLLLVTSGRVATTRVANGEQATITAGTGDLFNDAVQVVNEQSQAAVIVTAAIADPVEGQEAPVAQSAAPPSVPVATVPPVTSSENPAPVAPTPAPAAPTAAPAAPTAAPVAPTGGDSDADNLPDELEAQYGSDPLNPDFDGDGLADGDEVNTYGTDPTANDTDGDGLIDGEEVFTYGTNPQSSDADGDGLIDMEEIFTYGTDPAAFDSDGDGVPDGEEIKIYGTDPLDPNSRP